MAKKYNMKYLEVSAKNGMNVEECFRTLVTQIKDKYDELDEPIFGGSGVHIRKGMDGKIGSCGC